MPTYLVKKENAGKRSDQLMRRSEVLNFSVTEQIVMYYLISELLDVLLKTKIWKEP